MTFPGNPLSAVVFALVLFTLPLPCPAQLDIPAPGDSALIDFSGFSGAGFAPEPAAGELDSDTWAVGGLGDGALAFGETRREGAFARGMTQDAVSRGGIYALDDGGDTRLLIQPTAGDFTPGHLTLKLRNAGPATITSLRVAFDIYVRNDGERANALGFSWSRDGESYIAAWYPGYVTPETADTQGVVFAGPYVKDLVVLPLETGDVFYLRWTSDDISGSGSRDEIALDHIRVRALTSTGVVSAADVSSGALSDLVCLPNPVTDAANLHFRLSRPLALSIAVYTSTGVRALNLQGDMQLIPGEHTIPLDCTTLASGSYVLVLRSRDFHMLRRFVVLR